MTLIYLFLSDHLNLMRDPGELVLIIDLFLRYKFVSVRSKDCLERGP